MKLKLRYFGHLSESISEATLNYECPLGTDVARLRAFIAESYPDQAARIGRCMIAVNTEFATATQLLQDGDEVAFLPPVSGG